jgi:GNAT superfamily N-acetyltransferase
MDDRITIRPATPADARVLFALFAEEKAAELAPLGLSADQLQPLLEMQYRGREFSYSQAAANLADEILCLSDGTRVGRILVDRRLDCIRVMDVAVLANYRNRGIGTQALERVQLAAQKASLPVRLRVMKESGAGRLYQRLGFASISSDALSMEMEWQPVRAEASVNPSGAEQHDMVRRADHDEIVCRVVTFLKEIGLAIEFGAITSGDFLPGIQTIPNGLRIDVDALLYPGDLLHEAGHLAVRMPRQRAMEPLTNSDAAEEMGALAWSYAAALHLGISAEVVFHEHGYRGQASQLLHDYAHGRAVGLPYLWWIGMTTQPRAGQPSIYPRMLRWLREESFDTQEADDADCALQAHA